MDALQSECRPVEEIDPEFADLIAKVVRKEIPAIIVGCKVFDTSVEPPREVILNLPGRNDPCICGSGKKYKKCCMP